MTKEEIITLISEKIAGQGNQVDISGQLSAILTGIIGLIPEVPTPYELPVATSEVLGGVKVGSGLNVTEEGILSASGGRALIIKGTVNESNEFTPYEGQPTIVEASEAFLSGIPVLLDNLEEDIYAEIVIGYDDGTMVTKRWAWMAE